MKKLLSTLIFLFMLPLHSTRATENPNVVVSIKPIHSLVSAIMEGVSTPTLIVKSGSPHGYALRPSEANALAKADLVVWVGHELESFLEKPLNSLSKKAKKLTLSEQLKSSLLTVQSAGNWEHSNHDHGNHEAPEKHEDHEDNDKHEDHEDDEKHEGHGDDDKHESSMDLHIWLSPSIAQKIIKETSEMLIAIDPVNAQKYQANTVKLSKKLTALDKQLTQKLAPVKNIPYLVFHSAYQYFETSYDLNAIGSVTIDPERKPGAKRISEIRKKVRDLKAHAVFSEPQFESSLVATIIENTGAKTAILDPLGSDLSAGPEAYFQLMNGLADNLVNGLVD